LLLQTLNYVEHSWGRVTTSEMTLVDQMFPPRMTEGKVTELDDDEVCCGTAQGQHQLTAVEWKAEAALWNSGNEGSRARAKGGGVE